MCCYEYIYVQKTEAIFFHHEKLIIDLCLELLTSIASVIERYEYFTVDVQRLDQ
jgi:hypothetical protein